MSIQTKIIAIALIVVSLFVWHKYEVNKAITKTIAEQTAIHVEQVNQLKLKSLETQSKLYSQVSEMEYKKNAEIKSIDAKYRTAIDSLRQRQERSSSSNPTGNSNNPESTKGATGAGLYREDAELLIRFARDTEELKTHLKVCYAQYDSIYEQLNNYRK